MVTNESELILRLVEDFAKRSLAPFVERHDKYIQPDQLDHLAGIAEEIGLLSIGLENGGGLWDEVDSQSGHQLSTAILACLAEYNAGVSWHFHQLSFGSWLAQQLGVISHKGDGVILASIQGKYGLARTALPRFLLGIDLTDEDRLLLMDYFCPHQGNLGIVIHSSDHWQWLLFPIFNEDRIDWSYLPRDGVNIDHHAHSHGLDEIPCWSFTDQTEGRNFPLDVDKSRHIYSEATQMNALALMAISLGAVRHGYRLANEYAAIRYQGGEIINRHPVVQELLADIRSTVELCAGLLNQLSGKPLTIKDTGKVMAVRSKMQPLLCQAATNAVQIMGGIGYMRDTGVEKILRDVNQLRLMNGSPHELRLFVAEWERL